MPTKDLLQIYAKIMGSYCHPLVHKVKDTGNQLYYHEKEPQRSKETILKSSYLQQQYAIKHRLGNKQLISTCCWTGNNASLNKSNWTSCKFLFNFMLQSPFVIPLLKD